MSLKGQLIAEVIDREAGYVDHPSDRGGPTRYGITEDVARAHGYMGDMRDLPYETAFEIYAASYWHPLALDSIAAMHEPLAGYLFDFGVNSGPSRAGECLQRLLNVLNRCERDYADIVVDGAVGPATLTALRGYDKSRPDGMDLLAQSVNAMRIAYFVDIAEGRESQEAFTYGWMRRVIELEAAHDNS